MEEWRRGWRTVLGAALAAASGVSLLYFVFSLFIPHLQRETGWTLGQFSQLQALIGIGSLAAPLVGGMMDRYGFRKVWALGMVAIALLYLFIAFAPVVPILFGVMVFVTGLIGLTTTSISYTRAVNGWFVRQRGLALAFSAIGISLTAIFMPPLIERVIALEGWRSGYFLLAGIALLIGLPSILFLVADAPPRAPEDEGGAAQVADAGPDPFWRSAAYWLIAFSYIGINMPASGMLSQMVPMMLEEGLSSAQAATRYFGFRCRTVFRSARLRLAARPGASAAHRILLHAGSGGRLRSALADAEPACGRAACGCGDRCAARRRDRSARLFRRPPFRARSLWIDLWLGAGGRLDRHAVRCAAVRQDPRLDGELCAVSGRRHFFLYSGRGRLSVRAAAASARLYIAARRVFDRFQFSLARLARACCGNLFGGLFRQPA